MIITTITRAYPGLLEMPTTTIHIVTIVPQNVSTVVSIYDIDVDSETPPEDNLVFQAIVSAGDTKQFVFGKVLRNGGLLKVENGNPKIFLHTD